MTTAKKTKEELKRYTNQYLNDEKIKQFHHQISELYINSTPVGHIFNQSFTISHGNDVDIKVAKKRLELQFYIESNYPEFLKSKMCLKCGGEGWIYALNGRPRKCKHC